MKSRPNAAKSRAGEELLKVSSTISPSFCVEGTQELNRRAWGGGGEENNNNRGKMEDKIIRENIKGRQLLLRWKEEKKRHGGRRKQWLS